MLIFRLESSEGATEEASSDSILSQYDDLILSQLDNYEQNETFDASTPLLEEELAGDNSPPLLNIFLSKLNNPHSPGHQSRSARRGLTQSTSNPETPITKFPQIRDVRCEESQYQGRVLGGDIVQ